VKDCEVDKFLVWKGRFVPVAVRSPRVVVPRYVPLGVREMAFRGVELLGAGFSISRLGCSSESILG